jgi:uncharacterized HAD superfamily protein
LRSRPGERIYVDIDDVLACTIEGLVALLEETHGRSVDVEDVLYFDLEKSFGLSDSEIGPFMDRAHRDDQLEAIVPTPGAALVLSRWASLGRDVHLVTGRPPTTNASSKRWLSHHGIEHEELHHLDKWSRPSWNETGLQVLRFEDLHEYQFAFAVEDSLETAIRLVEDYDIEVALMDRPWNRDLESVTPATRSRLVRCDGWGAVSTFFDERS